MLIESRTEPRPARTTSAIAPRSAVTPSFSAHRRQVVGQLARRHQPERVVVHPAPDRGDDLLRLGGREDELHVRRRLLDDLEQRVRRVGREHVRLVDDVDLVPRGRRSEERAFAQVTGVVDQAVGGGVELDDVQAAAAAGRQVEAGLADPARGGGRPLLAVQAAGHDPRAGRLAAAARAAEQVGVVGAVVRQRLHQRTGDVVLADHVGEGRRPVAAVQRLGHASTLVGPTDVPQPSATIQNERGTVAPQRQGPPAHPPEPAYPCCLPALGGFSGMTPHEGSPTSLTSSRAPLEWTPTHHFLGGSGAAASSRS